MSSYRGDVHTVLVAPRYESTNSLTSRNNGVNEAEMVGSRALSRLTNGAVEMARVLSAAGIPEVISREVCTTDDGVSLKVDGWILRGSNRKGLMITQAGELGGFDGDSVKPIESFEEAARYSCFPNASNVGASGAELLFDEWSDALESMRRAVVQASV